MASIWCPMMLLSTNTVQVYPESKLLAIMALSSLLHLMLLLSRELMRYAIFSIVAGLMRLNARMVLKLWRAIKKNGMINMAVGQVNLYITLQAMLRMLFACWRLA